MNRIQKMVTLLAVVAMAAMAADVQVRLNAKGADKDPARAKRNDRIVWSSSGNNWRATFAGGRSPCQNGKSTFSSTETGQNRICTISVACAGPNLGSCRYKYTSASDGAPPVDPEIEVEP